MHDSFNFLDLIQCIIVRWYISIIHFVEPNHNRVASLGILHVWLDLIKISKMEIEREKGRETESANLIYGNDGTYAIVPVGFLPKNLHLWKEIIRKKFVKLFILQWFGKTRRQKTFSCLFMSWYINNWTTKQNCFNRLKSKCQISV